MSMLTVPGGYLIGLVYFGLYVAILYIQTNEKFSNFSLLKVNVIRIIFISVTSIYHIIGITTVIRTG